MNRITANVKRATQEPTVDSLFVRRSVRTEDDALGRTAAHVFMGSQGLSVKEITEQVLASLRWSTRCARVR